MFHSEPEQTKAEYGRENERAKNDLMEDNYAGEWCLVAWQPQSSLRDRVDDFDRADYYYESNSYREGVPCDSQAPGKEGFLKVSRHKSAQFGQHLLWKLCLDQFHSCEFIDGMVFKGGVRRFLDMIASPSSAVGQWVTQCTIGRPHNCH